MCLDSRQARPRASPYYEKALELGLEEEDLHGALLGLGSTYRALGEYERAQSVLRLGVDIFPGDKGFQVFLAMALYNNEDCKGACELLLRLLADTTEEESIARYGPAIRLYSDDLDRTW